MKNKSNSILGMAFFGPALVLMTIFLFIPMILTLIYSFTDYFADEHHKKELEDLLGEVEIEQENFEAEDRIFDGKIFVITGSLEHFKNRNALKELLEEKGAKVAGSVSSKTSYLINNDAASASSKNKKARELGVSVITEEELMALMGKAE